MQSAPTRTARGRSSTKSSLWSFNVLTGSTITLKTIDLNRTNVLRALRFVHLTGAKMTPHEMRIRRALGGMLPSVMRKYWEMSEKILGRALTKQEVKDYLGWVTKGSIYKGPNKPPFDSRASRQYVARMPADDVVESTKALLLKRDSLVAQKMPPIKVVYAAPNLRFYGLPYKLRSDQSPRDLWESMGTKDWILLSDESVDYLMGYRAFSWNTHQWEVFGG